MWFSAANRIIAILPVLLQRWLFHLASLIFKNPDYIWYFGKLMEERGKLTEAIKAYQAAESMVKRGVTSNKRTHLQRYQFNLTRALHKAGKPHPEDPLLEGEIKPAAAKEESVKESAGTFNAYFKYNGLSISFTTNRPDCEFVDLLINGTVFRTVRVANKVGKHKFTVRRPALSHFPARGELRIRASNGSYFLSDDSPVLEMYLPHGQGDIKSILDKHGVLEKKGDIALSDEEIQVRQNTYLQLYNRAKEYFDLGFGKNLFLIYGTLLGLYREGDFIKGDDDFDVCYISDKADPIAVKKEAESFIVNLVKAGFTVSFNQAGRPFRLRDSDHNASIHLDVRPLWFQDGMAWAHKQACLACKPDDFRPFKKTKMRDTEVYIPNKPEVFLEAYYGPGWKVPDPSYSNSDAQIDPSVHKNLNKLCLTIKDYQRMNEELLAQESDHPEMGNLIFMAAHDLYPLEVYEANCGW